MRVLVAVDMHDRPAEITREGGAWAARFGATVDLLYVAPWAASALYIEEPAVRSMIDAQYEEVRRRTEARMNELLRTLPAEQQGRARVLDGSPGRVIAEAAAGYDLVIVATHGRTGLGHLFLGSVAERVVRAVDTAVLVLRLPEEGA